MTSTALLRLWPVLCVAALAGPAHADLALARSKNCLSCHTVERKVIGPSFRDIGQRYQAQPAAQATTLLARKITQGGAGVWGAVPMPANTQVSDAEARQLAQWILQAR